MCKVKIFLVAITLGVQCVSLLAWAKSNCMSVPSKEDQRDNKNFDNFYKKFQQQSPECQQQVFHQMTDHLAHRRTPKVSTSNKSISDKSTTRQWSAWFQKEVEKEINWWGKMSEKAVEGVSNFGSDMLDSVNTDLYYNSEKEFKKIKNKMTEGVTEGVEGVTSTLVATKEIKDSIADNIKEVTSTLVALKDSQELKDMFEAMNNLPNFAESSTEGSGQKKVRVMGRVIKESEEPEETEVTDKPEVTNKGRTKQKKPDKIVVAQKTNQLKNLTSAQDTKTQAGSSCTGSCLNQNKQDDDQQLLNLFKNTKLEHKYKCPQFSPGEAKITSLGSLEWFVQMERDGNYSVFLPTNFVAGPDYDGEVPKNQVPTHYKSVVQKCLDRASRKMIGPNGEKLKIKLEPTTGVKIFEVEDKVAFYQAGNFSKDNSRKQTYKLTYEEYESKMEQMYRDNENYITSRRVRIESKNSRSTSFAYAPDINCPTIVHEILHLFGFADTYPKSGVIGFIADRKTGDIMHLGSDSGHESHKSCRFIQTNDIMSTHIERWCNVFGYQSEDCDNLEFLHILNKLTGEKSQWNPIQTNSLLKPSQFKMIVFGNCPVNRKYIKCHLLSNSMFKDNKECLKAQQSCIKQFSKEI